MNKKLPYYMAYPLPLQYDDERRERMDYEYMKSLYPDMAKKILPYVEEECDRMEYKCSMMYDEYPDRLQLRMMCRRVYDNVMKNEKLFYGDGYEEMYMEEPESEQEGMWEIMEEQQIRRPGSLSRPRRTPDWMQNLIEVMLYHELYKRRCDHRRCSHRIY